MSDPQQSRPMDRLLDGALFMAVASFGLLLHPVAIGIGAAIVAGMVLALRAPALKHLIGDMGPAGWIVLIFGCAVFGSAAWSIDPVYSVQMALPVFLACLLGMPAVLLMNRAGPGDLPNWMAILTVCIVAGLIVFEAVSGGLLRRLVPGGAGLFVLLVAFMALAMWPMAALIHLRFGWKEGAIWVIASLIALGFSGFMNFLGAAVIGLLFFGLGLLSSLLARALLVLGIVVGGMGVALALTLFAPLFDMLPAILTPMVTAWQNALPVWADTPLQGTGAGTAVPAMAESPGQNAFLQLLIGTGGIGLILGMLAIGLTVLRAVRSEEGNWRGAAAAGLCGSGLTMAMIGPGLWQPWWIGTLAVSAIALAACRRPAEAASGGGALGSIFDAAREAEAEEGQADGEELYHFDDYDDEFDEDEEWEIDESRVEDEDDRDEPDALGRRPDNP